MEKALHARYRAPLPPVRIFGVVPSQMLFSKLRQNTYKSTLEFGLRATRVSSVTADCVNFEEEEEHMSKHLDEKDEEINQQYEYIEKLKEQLLEQEEIITTSREDYEKLQQEMVRIQSENEEAKDEIKEVLQALEELAINYDQKASEADIKSTAFDSISEELALKQMHLNSTLSDLQQLRDISSHQTKKSNDMIVSLLQDLNEIGQAIGSTPLVDNVKLEERLDEEFTAGRLLVAKIKSEVKNLVYRCQTLESTHNQTDCTKKIDDNEKSLGESVPKVYKTEDRMSDLQETVKDVDTRKRALE